jgi:3-deoxy-manno-octulosonate cytidylyltransferase (CMP-KDO synthetase)
MVTPSILAVIPARYDSQRFPGKPLVKIGDHPLIQWVYEATVKCQAFSQVIVATDHPGIADCVTQFGGQVAMTRPDHPSGTDRVAEVARRYVDQEIIVNVQGDQPFVTAAMLESLIAPYCQGQSPAMTTLACPLPTDGPQDANIVKVICDQQSQALYFSRAPIPYYRHPHPAPVYQHLGLYAFRRDFLLTYAQLPPTPLEQCEGLEQLRALEHGYQIQVCLTSTPILEINTPADLAQAQNFLNHSAP